jgi:glycolate oxidase iron-sulfur subunit
MAQDLQALADACIHCGLCLDACPTYAELGTEPDSPRGRIYYMRALLEERVAPTPDVTAHLDSCLGCRACETACPSGVKYGHLLEGIRARIGRQQKARPSLWHWVVRHVLPDRRVFRALTWPARMLAGGPTHWLPDALARPVAMFPPAMPHAPLQVLTPAQGTRRRGRAGFLAGCAMPVLYPHVNAASVGLLASVGYDVVVPPEAGCCGALQAHDGDAAGAERQAKATVAAFSDCDIVVTNTAGCGAAMKGYQDEAFARKVRDLSEVLVDADWRPAHPASTQVAVYHDPCHLSHGQGIRAQPRELLRRAGFHLAEVAEADYCCGGAGSYTLLQPDLADRLMRRKVANLAAVNPACVITANPSCLMQIRRGLAGLASGGEVPVLHLAEVLWASSSAWSRK